MQVNGGDSTKQVLDLISDYNLTHNLALFIYYIVLFYPKTRTFNREQQFLENQSLFQLFLQTNITNSNKFSTVYTRGQNPTSAKVVFLKVTRPKHFLSVSASG